MDDQLVVVAVVEQLLVVDDAFHVLVGVVVGDNALPCGDVPSFEVELDDQVGRHGDNPQNQLEVVGVDVLVE